jgi:ATP-binding cassette subfamily B protein
MMMRAVFTVVLALAIKIVIDSVVEPSAGVPELSVIALLFGGFVVSMGAGLVAARLTSKATAEIVADVRTAAFTKLQTLPLSYHDRTATGDLIGHFSSDVALLSRGVVQKPLIGLRAITAMVLYLPALYLLDWRLALMAAIAFPIVVYVVFRFAPDSGPSLDAEKQRIADVLDEVSSNLRSQKILRAFSVKKRSERRFQERVAELKAASSRAEWRIALEQVIAEYSLELVKVVIIAIGAVFAFGGSLDAGSFAASAAILTQFSYQASVLGMDALPSVKQSDAGIRRIDALLETEVSRSEGSRTLAPTLSGTITFDDIVFRYDGEEDALLDGFSLEVPPQSYVAIVGPNGSGKSSILNVLLGLYEIEGGTVSVDGVDLATVDTDEMRRRMGVAFEKTYVFDGSIQENVTLGDDSLEAADLDRAVSDSGLSTVVGHLPGGLDRMIGPNGFTLSEGESQRVGIARALVRTPELLLLDQVATTLDPEGEADLTLAIERLRAGRSIVTITHRLASVTNADMIVVVEDGCVSESGTFGDLLRSEGTFSTMWKKQHGFDVSANGLTASVHPDRLHEVPLFADLDQQTLVSLSEAFDSLRLEPGEVIFHEGDPGNAFYVIARGVVEVVTDIGGPNMKIVAYLEDGDFFGEMALLWDQRRTASIRVRSTTTLLHLDRAAFEELIATVPDARGIIEAEAESRAAENLTRN